MNNWFTWRILQSWHYMYITLVLTRKKSGGSNILSEYRHSSINKLSFKPGTIHWLKANEIPLLDLQRLQIDLFICVAQIEQVNNFYGITPQLKYISKAIAYSKFGMIESELIGFLKDWFWYTPLYITVLTCWKWNWFRLYF